MASPKQVNSPHQQTLLAEEIDFALLPTNKRLYGTTLKTPQSLVHIRHSININEYKVWLLMCQAYRNALLENTMTDKAGWCSLSRRVVDTYLKYDFSTQKLHHCLEALRIEPLLMNILEKDGQPALHSAGFISESKITSARIQFKLPSVVCDAIEAGNDSFFSLINWEIMSELPGKYETLLWKLCNDYKRAGLAEKGYGSTPELTIADYRTYMGVKDHEYKQAPDFNRHCLYLPIDKINDSVAGDFTIELIVRRKGRAIATVAFRIHPKKKAPDALILSSLFSEAQVEIPLTLQEWALEKLSDDDVRNSIRKANSYISKLAESDKQFSAGAIYRKALEENWGKELTESERVRQSLSAEAKKKKTDNKRDQAAKEAAAERETQMKEFVRLRTLELQNSLTSDQHFELVRVFMEEKGLQESAYDQTARKFRNALNTVAFRAWFNQNVHYDFVESEFEEWLKTKK